MPNAYVIALVAALTPIFGWSCFDEYPGIQVEKIPPLGTLVWSPLMPWHEVERWLGRSGFASLKIAQEAEQADVFWVKGRCLAQVIRHQDGIHGWLVGSEHTTPWFNVLEPSDATRT